MKPVKTLTLIFLLILISSTLFTLSYLRLEVLKVIVDDNTILLLKATSVNITLVYIHSYLLTEVREVYDVRNGQICVMEVTWSVGGAGAPASLSDLAHLRGSIKVEDGKYIVTNAEFCLGRTFVVGTAFMNNWEVFINGYRITEGNEIRFELDEVSRLQYVIARITSR